MLQADLCEPRAYALLRAVTWLAVTDPPPASQGRTAILPPTDQRQAEFTALRDAGDPAQLVLALERYCSGSGIFWLDGHRLAAAALGELGARYHGCVAAIIHGLAALIARLPALPALAFSDGQPFADAATRAWIETVVTPRPSSAAANTEQDPWKAGLSEAQALLLGGKAEAGLAGLVTAGRWLRVAALVSSGAWRRPGCASRPARHRSPCRSCSISTGWSSSMGLRTGSPPSLS